LLLPWYGKVFLNPPYARGLIEPFVRKAIAEHKSGYVEEAIVLTRPSVDTKWFHELLQYPVCFLRGRIKFYTPYKSYHGKVFSKNTYDNHAGTCFFYLGYRTERFKDCFESVGSVKL